MTIEQRRQEKLQETEEHLRLVGLEKCIQCQIWGDKEELNNNICLDCNGSIK